MGKYEEMIERINRLIDNGVSPMEEYDYDVCCFIAQNLDEMPLRMYETKPINVNKMCSKTLESFSIFNDQELFQKVFHTIKNTRILIKKDDLKRLKINQFNSLFYTEKRDENNLFKAKAITIPREYDDLAPVYYGHELCHIMKDRYPFEYKDMLKYADVIPMFYELIQAYRYDQTSSKAIINNRLSLLKASERYVNEHYSRDNYDYISEIIDSKRCQYLNSFYYSLLLYEMYKINPTYILNEIKKIFNGEINTSDLIYILGLRDRSNDMDVKDQLCKLKNRY